MKIPENKQMDQPEMLDKFREELSGIFLWAVDGFRDFRDNGLVVPSSVEAATAKYRSDSDVLGAFLNECVLKDIGVYTPVKKVYDTFKKWCEDSREFVIKKKIFKESLIEHGFSEPVSIGKNVQNWKDLKLIGDYCA